MIEELRRVAEERRFRGAISRSWIAVYVVADHFRRLGHDVTIPRYQLRPAFEEKAGYGDAEDLIIGSRWKIEVKWRCLGFTCAADYPYGSVFVDRCNKADASLPDGYVTVSENLDHGALIKASTKPLWQRSVRHDRVKGYPLQVYECPVWAVRFAKLAA